MPDKLGEYLTVKIGLLARAVLAASFSFLSALPVFAAPDHDFEGVAPTNLASPPTARDTAQRVDGSCSTAQAAIHFDFEGASRSSCWIEGEREFSILVTPEHAPPINPSPWYAFRYEASGEAPVIVTLQYLEAKHRYAPKLNGSSDPRLSVEIGDEGAAARLTLPGGSATVSGQPLVASEATEELLTRLASGPGAQRIELGRSHGGRAVEAVRFGNPSAPNLVILLGRQHPPEVTGNFAFGPFTMEVQQRLEAHPALSDRFQVIAVPMLNPDGVVLGHWRANKGGVDLNRDWGIFSQPETRAVRDWLDQLPEKIRPVVMIDFHSTNRNLFYVQGDEASRSQEEFLGKWLAGKETAFPQYQFTIERRNANPGSGTSKNWFHEVYGIPAYTYEVGDNTSENDAAAAAAMLAADFIEALSAQHGAE